MDEAICDMLDNNGGLLVETGSILDGTDVEFCSAVVLGVYNSDSGNFLFCK